MARGGRKFNKKRKGGGFSQGAKKRYKYAEENKKRQALSSDSNQDKKRIQKVAARVEDIHSSSSEGEEDANTPYQALVSSVLTNKPELYLSDEDCYSTDNESIGDEEGEEIEGQTDDASEAADEDEGSDDIDSDLADDDISGDDGDEDDEKDDHQSDQGEEEEDEESSDIEIGETQQDVSAPSDPFLLHFEHDLDENIASKLDDASSWVKKEIKVPVLGRCTCQKPAKTPDSVYNFKETDLKNIHVKQILSSHAASTNVKLAKVKLKETESLSSLQQQLFTFLNAYQDMYYADRTFENGEELRLVYCLHALNHILKTRNRVINHNTKLKAKSRDQDEEYRDQGLTRPKVLIVVPFRDSAYRVINMMANLLMADDQESVLNKKRFVGEYGEEEGAADLAAAANKPDDFNQTFSGNIDDHFRIGVGVARKSLKLYSEFYKSDIIVASPLGLRTAIGAEGDLDRDFDFLSSIEVFIMDQADIFHMQNWDHIQHLLEHMHIQPKESHGADFSRIRTWALNGWSKYYQQSIIISSFPTPAINSVFNRNCKNRAGKILIPKSPTKGTIRLVVTQLPQVWHRIEVKTHAEVADARFEFFVEKILPKIKDDTMAGILLFIPSYFDFVRLRNYFKKEGVDFVFCNEYTKEKSVNRARGLFFHGKVRILMYTERCHFYKRLRLRGIRHLVFYDLPLYAQFYSEICNLVMDPKKRDTDDNYTCSVLYTKYDAQKLVGIVGNERAGHMISAEKRDHLLVTGDS